jgi:hypothetical protein
VGVQWGEVYVRRGVTKKKFKNFLKWSFSFNEKKKE